MSNVHAMPNRVRGAYDAIVYLQDDEVIAEVCNGAEILSGDAGTDDGAVLCAAIDFVSDNGNSGLIVLAPGNYNFEDSPPLLKTGIALRGGNLPYSEQAWYPTRDTTKPQCARILCTDTTTPALRVNASCLIENIQFVYPDQLLTGTPDVYPAAIQLVDAGVVRPGNVHLYNIDFQNAYWAVDAITAANASRGLIVRDCCGYPLKRGIVWDGGDDVIIIDNVRFWWAFVGASLQDDMIDWVQDNGAAFIIGRSDHGRILNSTIWNYKYGVYLAGTDHFDVIGCTLNAEYPIYGKIASEFDGFTFDNPTWEPVSIRAKNNTLLAVRRAIPHLTTARAVYINGGSNHNISDNDGDSGGTCLEIHADDSKVKNNNMYAVGMNTDAASWGLVMTGDQNEVTENTFDGQFRDNTNGIDTTGATNLKIRNNTVKNISSSGVEVQGIDASLINRALGEEIDIRQTRDVFTNVLARTDDYILDDAPLEGTTPLDLSSLIVHQPPGEARTIRFKFNSHSNITAFTLQISGASNKGVAQTINYTQANGWEWESLVAFQKITVIKLTARTGTGTGDTLDVGIGETFGLGNSLRISTDVKQVKKVVAGTPSNLATALCVISSTYDTIKFDSLSGGETFEVSYFYNPNV